LLPRHFQSITLRTHVFNLLKPIEDPKAWDDQGFLWQKG